LLLSLPPTGRDPAAYAFAAAADNETRMPEPNPGKAILQRRSLKSP
jgi:hypothetical protein